MNRSKLALYGALVILAIGGISGLFIYTDIPTLDPQTDPAKTTPNADKDINVRNSYRSLVTVDVEVQRDLTDNTVYEEQFLVGTDSNLEGVYNLQAADPDGIETFTIESTYKNRTKTIQVKTNDCFGDITIEVTSDGSLFPFYYIC